jgi:hypothetical protein
MQQIGAGRRMAGRSVASDWRLQASMSTYTGDQKDAAAGSTAGQKDVAVSNSPAAD